MRLRIGIRTSRLFGCSAAEWNFASGVIGGR